MNEELSNTEAGAGTDRRALLRAGLAVPLLALGGVAAAQAPSSAGKLPPEKMPYKRIATEEAWIAPEVVAEYRKVLQAGESEELVPQWGTLKDSQSNPLLDMLLDIGDRRIADMDATGIDMQVLSLTAPGVQVFRPDVAVGLAAVSNDRLAEAVRANPTRFAGLAAVAPQAPAEAAKELERGVHSLGLKGAIINSHTHGEYLDDSKFWPIFEAAEALDVPIYLHPQIPSPGMLQPYLARGFEKAIMGYGHEVSLHVLAIIASGAFDRFPRLKLVIGHGGEGLPYMLYRIDYMWKYTPGAKPGRIKLLPSDYMRRNIFITTSGMPSAPALKLAREVLGMDRILYAMDYPYGYDVEEVRLTDALPFEPAEIAALYQHNPARVFKLPV